MTIENLTHDIRIIYSVGNERTISKSDIGSIVVKNGDTINLELIGNKNRTANNFILLPYTDVSSPTTTSIYQLRDLLITYKNANLSAMNDGTFTNADLVAGVLTITHGLSSIILSVVIRDPAGTSQLMSDTPTDANNTTVDFGGAIGAGTWTWLVIAKI